MDYQKLMTSVPAPALPLNLSVSLIKIPSSSHNGPEKYLYIS